MRQPAHSTTADGTSPVSHARTERDALRASIVGHVLDRSTCRPLYQRTRPDESRADLALGLDADNTPLRLSSYTVAERKVAQGTAASSLYYFCWRAPVLDD